MRTVREAYDLVRRNKLPTAALVSIIIGSSVILAVKFTNYFTSDKVSVQDQRLEENSDSDYPKHEEGITERDFTHAGLQGHYYHPGF